MRPPRALFLLCLFAFLAAVPAAQAETPRPYVKGVTPLNPSVGEKMTLQGFYFTPGYAENMVVLVSRDGRVSYVRSEHSTKTTMTIILPKRLERLLRVVNGVRVPTRFRVKVIARRMSRLATGPLSRPVIGPDVASDCDKDGRPNRVDADDDNDVLPDALERRARTNPCLPDSDGDKLLDGWEYMSALDLNHNALPYPGKRPFPNALFADAAVDYDGDGMDARAEHAMWWLGGRRYPLDYSDGDQTTQPIAVPSGQPWLDIDGNGSLSDDERDFDGDALSNVAEYWFVEFQPWPTYPGVIRPEFLVTDTDGDGLADGWDDQDHDDISNVDEYRAGLWAMNPCDPNPLARTCPKYGGKATMPEGLCPSSTQLNGGQVHGSPKFDLATYKPEAGC